jgi:RNA methyltransferase, TrmH family
MNQFKEITSLQNPLIKHWVHLRQNHDYREEHQSVIIEGSTLVREICPTSPTKAIVATDPTLIPKGIKADQILLVTEQVMKKISSVQSPEGILAEVAMPAKRSLNKKKRILVLDGVSDPGNVGTLLRTALALGWEGVFILSNTCDPYNDKAIRAAKGATFRLPIVTGMWEDLEKMATANKLQIAVADLEGIPAEQLEVGKGIALVLSNEAHGLSREAQNFPKVKVPMSEKMESLNVAAAGAILMYLLPRKSK